ncbi:LLM class flavin-dependent oxidoreductase [Angustibacter sp. Root456]|uniref:LLM class flavin-dependent oxidoreductase n=1 Tax=Angustibacter sp. Root456 TaxID=1736539 RepID=UPI0007020E5B|nr:LLM class flavin-dependent oxidoreductase [Angustibacter sp. Root456]KQX67032.1 luciferase [Angustibacter sp. Root456]
MPASERKVRVGVVVLPQQRWSQAAARWRAVEAMGFDHAWTYDHLAWQSLADEPWFATVPTLTAAATVTERIELGTWVASPNYRHPVPFAKEVMSLDDVSGARFVLGVGAGGTGWDARVLGQDELTPRERVERLQEFVRLLDLLLTQSSTTWRGQWFEAVEARMVSGPIGPRRPPFVVAANGPRAMAVAATLGDGWATTGATAAEAGQDAWWRGVGELSRRFDEALEAAGREGGAVRRYLNLDSGAVFSLSSAEVFADALGRAEELGFTDVVTHWPRAEGVYAGDEAVLEQVAGQLL